MSEELQNKNRQEKLRIVLESSALSEQELNTFLEKEGIQLTQLQAWKHELLSELCKEPTRPIQEKPQKVRKKEGKVRLEKHFKTIQSQAQRSTQTPRPKPRKKLNWLLDLGCALFTFFAFLIIIAPYFMKHTGGRKRSERAGNLKAIGNGAQSWYGEQRNNQEGDPMRRHFPSAASPTGITSGSYTNPPQKPCANGNAQYRKNGKIWDKQPWRSLKFGVNKAHYAQYIYVANNDEKNPSFTVMALADLDCDGTFSTYHVKGTKAANGEIIRSSLVVTNGLE